MYSTFFKLVSKLLFLTPPSAYTAIFQNIFSLFLGKTFPSYIWERVEDRQLRSPCQWLHIRGDSAWNEESQSVSGFVCKGRCFQESGIALDTTFVHIRTNFVEVCSSRQLMEDKWNSVWISIYLGIEQKQSSTIRNLKSSRKQKGSEVWRRQWNAEQRKPET